MTYELLSDLHKEAYGFRPSMEYRVHFHSCPEGEKAMLWEELEEAAAERDAYRRAAEADALDALTDRIEETIKLGAPDRRSALEWIFEAEGFDAYDLMYGGDFMSYHFGLAYRGQYHDLFNKVAKDMLAVMPKEEM